MIHHEGNTQKVTMTTTAAEFKQGWQCEETGQFLCKAKQRRSQVRTEGNLKEGEEEGE